MSTPVSDSGELLRAVIDANPSYMFVVDDDVRILDANRAGAGLLGESPAQELRQRGGEALHCIHASDSPDGCGRGPCCPDCVIRNSVKAAFAGQRVVRQRAKLELAGKDEVVHYHAMITASPFSLHGQGYALLVIEDINELVSLRRIIPICPWCRQVRQDADFWMDVETYLNSHLDIDFRHNVCPDCSAEMLEEREEY